MVYLIAALVATSAALLVSGVVELVPDRSRAVLRRLAELHGAEARRRVQRRRRQVLRERLEAILQVFGERVASRRAERSAVKRTLIQAGYRRPNAVAIYLALRILLMAGFGGIVLFTLPLVGARPRAVILMGGTMALLGWTLPRIILLRQVAGRKREIQNALADALDLLVVCVEAGLGLNQAMVRVAREIEHVSPTLSEELRIVNLEIQTGSPRAEALRNLGERTGVEDVRSLTGMLIQTDRFGTSIAQALRVHSNTLRTKRRQRAEEAAAKTAIKLIFPLVFFIFPPMFVVILGPAVLRIMAQLKGLM